MPSYHFPFKAKSYWNFSACRQENTYQIQLLIILMCHWHHNVINECNLGICMTGTDKRKIKVVVLTVSKKKTEGVNSRWTYTVHVPTKDTREREMGKIIHSMSWWWRGRETNQKQEFLKSRCAHKTQWTVDRSSQESSRGVSVKPTQQYCYWSKDLKS